MLEHISARAVPTPGAHGAPHHPPTVVASSALLETNANYWLVFSTSRVASKKR